MNKRQLPLCKEKDKISDNEFLTSYKLIKKNKKKFICFPQDVYIDLEYAKDIITMCEEAKFKSNAVMYAGLVFKFDAKDITKHSSRTSSFCSEGVVKREKPSSKSIRRTKNNKKA